MFGTWFRGWRKQFLPLRSGTLPLIRRRARPRLAIERLETRVAPVIGAFADAPPVAPGTGYDGVVEITRSDGLFGELICTGSLLMDGRHILTAAHCVDKD